jgi:uncharacterized protein (TIGR02246 family)
VASSCLAIENDGVRRPDRYRHAPVGQKGRDSRHKGQQGDPKAYAGVFTADADYVTFLGSHYKGRKAIAASYAPLFKKLLKGSRLDAEITQLRFLTSDVALIQATAAVTRKSGRRGRPHTRVNTSIAVRTEVGWLLAASQNTTHRRPAEKLMLKLASRP